MKKIISKLLLVVIVGLGVIVMGAGIFFNLVAEKQIKGWINRHYANDFKYKELHYVIPGTIITKDVELIGKFKAETLRLSFPKESIEILLRSLKLKSDFVSIPARLWVNGLVLENPIELDNKTPTLLSSLNKGVNLESVLILDFTHPKFELTKISFNGDLIVKSSQKD